jgi:hypothetical protein
MAQVAEQVGLVSVGVEPNGSLGVELTYPDDFTHVPVVEHQIVTLNDPRESPAILQSRLDQRALRVQMPRNAAYQAVMNMQALAARASGLAVRNVIGQFLRTVMGGEFIGTGTTVNDAGATTTVIILTSAANFREGGIAVFVDATTGEREARVIKTVSSNTITLKHALSSAPDNGATVYAGITYYLDNMDGSTVLALQMVMQGLGGDDRWLCKAGQCLSGFSMDLANGAIPRITFPVTFADWAPADGNDTTMDLFGDALADGAFSSTGIQAIKDSQFRLETGGGSTPAIVPAIAYSFVPNISYAQHKFPGGNNNVYGYVRTRSADATMSGDFLIPYEGYDDHDLDEWYEDGNVEYDIQLQIGSGSAGGILIDVPHAIVHDVKREDAGGIAGRRVSWYAREDSRTTANSTNIQKSAFRIHMF